MPPPVAPSARHGVSALLLVVLAGMAGCDQTEHPTSTLTAISANPQASTLSSTAAAKPGTPGWFQLIHGAGVLPPGFSPPEGSRAFEGTDPPAVPLAGDPPECDPNVAILECDDNPDPGGITPQPEYDYGSVIIPLPDSAGFQRAYFESFSEAIANISATTLRAKFSKSWRPNGEACSVTPVGNPLVDEYSFAAGSPALLVESGLIHWIGLVRLYLVGQHSFQPISPSAPTLHHSSDDDYCS